MPWGFIARCAVVFVLLFTLAAGALWVWPGYLLAKPWQRPGPAPAELVIYFSNDVHGNLEPCGCTPQRWGGIARARGLLKGQDQSCRLLVDVGDAVAGKEHWQVLGWQQYLQALTTMGYQAANIGISELALDAETLRATAKDSPLPLLSCNVQDEKGQPLTKPWRQELIANLRVTVVGVVVPSATTKLGAGVRVADADEQLSRILGDLRKQTDVIVLLASADPAAMQRLAQAHPEVDVLLGGRVPQASREVELVGSCRLASLANNGQMIGEMTLGINPDGTAAGATSRMIVLDNDVPEDPQMLELVAGYNAQLERLNRTGGLAALGVEAVPAPAGAGRYVGAATCGQCHAKAYEIWEKTGHSSAYGSLTRRGRDANPGCVVCHVVELGAADGFRGPTITPDRIGVQCESCHGRGSRHVAARRNGENTARMGKVSPKSCDACHDCIHSPAFDYASYWQKIKH